MGGRKKGQKRKRRRRARLCTLIIEAKIKRGGGEKRGNVAETLQTSFLFDVKKRKGEKIMYSYNFSGACAGKFCRKEEGRSRRPRKDRPALASHLSGRKRRKEKRGGATRFPPARIAKALFPKRRGGKKGERKEGTLNHFHLNVRRFEMSDRGRKEREKGGKELVSSLVSTVLAAGREKGEKGDRRSESYIDPIFGS